MHMHMSMSHTAIVKCEVTMTKLADRQHGKLCSRLTKASASVIYLLLSWPTQMHEVLQVKRRLIELLARYTTKSPILARSEWATKVRVVLQKLADTATNAVKVAVVGCTYLNYFRAAFPPLQLLTLLELLSSTTPRRDVV